jgi:hypothetical protein
MVGRALVERLGFLAYDPAFSGGVYVGCADLDGDGRGDLIVGAGAGGGPHVRAFRVIGTSVVELLSFHAFDPAFRGGVRVTAGDVDGDGVAEIIVGAGPGGGPHVRVFAMTDDVPRELSSFLAYHPSFAGGVFVAAGPVWDDGRVGIVTGADAGGGPHVRAFSGAGHDIGADFLAYNPLFAGGVRVAIVSVTGAAYEILTVAGPGCTATVRRFFASGVSAGADLVAY